MLFDISSSALSTELNSVSGWRPDMNIDGVQGYTLGYLLRKLPNQLPDENDAPLTLVNFGRGWQAVYGDGDTKHNVITSTPEDSAARLAIELFKQEILKAERHTEGTNE